MASSGSTARSRSTGLLRRRTVAAVVGAAVAVGAAGSGTAISRRLRHAGPTSAVPKHVALMIDATRPLRRISPLIYGVAAAGPEDVRALGARLNRWGGNP